MPRSHKVGNQFVITKPKSSGDKEHEQLVKTTEKWVAQTFYGELMKQMHNSPFKDKMFSGGRGGEAFGQMFDQKLAEKMSSGAGHKLVDSIVDSIERKRAKGESSPSLGAHRAKRPIANPMLSSQPSFLGAGVHA
jgi:Rod binding domain-containing protein